MPKHPEEQIRNYAHQLWEKAGCPVGKSEDFWQQAEIELDAESETNEPTTVPLL
jgi:hypothetical protein